MTPPGRRPSVPRCRVRRRAWTGPQARPGPIPGPARADPPYRAPDRPGGHRRGVLGQLGRPDRHAQPGLGQADRRVRPTPGPDYENVHEPTVSGDGNPGGSPAGRGRTPFGSLLEPYPRHGRQRPDPDGQLGSMTGANMGEWFDGRSLDRAAISSIVVAPSKCAGSAPPSSQYTQGAPAALASMPTSSLPVTGPGSTIIGDSRPQGRQRPGAGSLVVDDGRERGNRLNLRESRSSGGGRLVRGRSADGGHDPVA